MSAVNNDLPTLEDKLEWEEEQTRLIARLTQCATPHVLGVHGDWGSGKTSFMRQIQFALGGKVDDCAAVQAHTKALPEEHQSKVMTIWFDAWRYQNEPSLVVALLQEIRRQMPKQAAYLAKAKKLTEIAMMSILDGVIGTVGKLIGYEALPDSAKIEKRAEIWEKDHHAQALQTHSIHQHLQKAFDALLPDDAQARIVIFIDDLDRCNPKAAMRLLEGLKIYLSIEKCVFVLGMNEGVLVDAIAEEFSSLKTASSGELSLRASHYLEKICSDIYRLPLPHSNSTIFGEWISANVDKSAKSDKSPIFSANEGAKHVKALQEALGDLQVLPPNPRRLKALANQWPRFAACEGMPQDEGERKYWAVRVLIATYIHQFNRDLWERWRFNKNFWKEIVKWCVNPLEGRDDKGLYATKDWANALKPTLLGMQDPSSTAMSYQPNFPNPGDQTVFWLCELIIQYKKELEPDEFLPYLRYKRTEPA